MSNIQTQHIYRVDLDLCPLRAELEQPLSHTDSLADEFIIHVRRSMTPADLTGMSVLGTLTWDGHKTLPLRGMIHSAQGSAVSLTLPEEAYAIPGAFTLCVQLTDGDVRHTLLHLNGQILRTSGDVLIPAEAVLPTLPEFLEHMQEMDDAAATALNAADQAHNATEALTARVTASLADCAEAIQAAGPAILCDMNGSPAICIDAAARPAVQIVSTINPAQPGTGDPSPDNVRPIPGFDAVTLTRTGKNLLGFREYSVPGTGVYSDIYANGVFRREVQQTHETSFVIGATALQNIISPHIPAGTYTFTLTHMSGPTFSSPYLEVTLTDGSIVNMASGATTTLPLDGTITGVRASLKQFRSGSVIEFVMQLEAGAGTAYEPYSGVTLTADLPETVYGGTLDWTTGLLTVTHIVRTYTGSEAWENSTSDAVYKLPLAIPSTALVMNTEFYHLCSHYKPTYYKEAQDDKTCYSLNAHNLMVKDTSVGSLDSFKAYLAAQAAAGTPMTIVWRLKPASYVTHQLTPQQLDMLKGCNAVRSDAGEANVVYVADTRMYIDNAVAAVKASFQTA